MGGGLSCYLTPAIVHLRFCRFSPPSGYPLTPSLLPSEVPALRAQAVINHIHGSLGYVLMFSVLYIRFS
jgi:hypothetical protein